MVNSFSIRNFRSFDEAEVSDCRRVNVVVGDNGSGKTALLEALFLAAGVSPEIALRTRMWRGYEGGQMSGSNEDVHLALWGDIFHNFQTSRAAVVSLKGAAEQNRSVTVRLNTRGQRRAVAPSRKSPGLPVRTVPVEAPIEFRWKIQGLPDVRVEPILVEGRLQLPDVPASYVRASFFAANRTSTSLEMANRFSNLSKHFSEKQFVSDFTRLYPNIQGLSVELGAGVPALFASVRGLSQKIPISLASGGMNKLASVLLAMTEHRGGIVFVDEIENGFYYERLPMVWDALWKFVQDYDCQAFVSTHSAECLAAAARLAEKHSQDFCMFRTVLGESGATRLLRFEGDQFANAILSNIEVR